MSLLEFGEAFLWFCLCIAITVVGMLAAVFAMGMCYFRGTKTGRFTAFCVILSVLSPGALWLIFVLADPPAAMVFAAWMSVVGFMAFASWLARYDRS